jgi:hypothetical protein
MEALSYERHGELNFRQLCDAQGPAMAAFQHTLCKTLRRDLGRD